MAALTAQQRGRELAQKAARDRETERKAKEPQRPFNEFQHIIDNLPPALAHKSRVRELKAKAASRERQIESELAERARLEKIASDPATINAIENAGFVLKAVEQVSDPDGELRALAQENMAIATEGSHALYWSRTKELETRLFEAQDRATQERLAAREASSKAFNDAAEQLEASRQRLEAAQAASDQTK